MRVRVKLFAMLREAAGTDSVSVEVGPEATVADAIDAVGRVEGLASMVARMPVVMAVNHEYANADDLLSEGDELALIPPVSGGGPGGDRDRQANSIHARVTDEPLSLDGVSARVGCPEAGAIVTFQGVTRAVDRLDYEAYAEMAELAIRRILAEVLDGTGALAASAEHRTGPVALGEPSVVVAVSAAHREEAFTGARMAIDRIKAKAPIWKRETEGERVEWVEGEAPTVTGRGVRASEGSP